ncbi:MAG: protein kinase [candidate division Zixibacteria bacterium]|nr:protein kinase [candidate division Zixibacteria bacterium]
MLQKSSHIIVPLDIYKENGEIGYLMQFVPGVKLLEILENPTFSLREGIQLSLDICWLAEILHQQNIAHGDLNHKNIMVNQNENGIEVYCIDLDNYFTPGAPPSRMAGHLYSMPPEFNNAVQNKLKITPSLLSDSFSLSIMIYENILLTSPAAGSDGSPEEIALRFSQPWWSDPLNIDPHSNPHGNYPVAVLNNDLCGLFRRGINPNIDNRPTVFEWIAALEKALTRIYICPKCGYPTIIDQSKTCCPLNKHPFERLGLFIKKNQKTIPFNQTAMLIGRDQIKGSNKISKYHISCKTIGPHVWIESIGKNSTFRWSGNNWIKLQNKKQFLLKKNDKLKLADTKVKVIRIN